MADQWFLVKISATLDKKDIKLTAQDIHAFIAVGSPNKMEATFSTQEIPEDIAADMQAVIEDKEPDEGPYDDYYDAHPEAAPWNNGRDTS